MAGGGALAFGDGIAFVNQAGGVFEISPGASLTLDAGSNTGTESFQNFGVFRTMAGPGSASADMPFENLGPTGAIEVPSGTLYFSRGLATSGAVTILADATLAVGYYSEEWSSGRYVQTGGQTQLAGGDLTAGEVDLQAGSLTGAGTIRGDLNNAAEVQAGVRARASA